MITRVFFYNYKTSDFGGVTYHSIFWNSETVPSGVIWTFLDLTFDRSWVTEYRNDIFFLYIPCHSRHRVCLQCHCQLRLKTGGRCNDVEPRASIISFSSKTHSDNQFLLWELPERYLPPWVSVSPIQENPETGRGKCNAEIRHQLSLWSTNKILARWQMAPSASCFQLVQTGCSSIKFFHKLEFLSMAVLWSASRFSGCEMISKQVIKSLAFPSSEFCSLHKIESLDTGLGLDVYGS